MRHDSSHVIIALSINTNGRTSEFCAERRDFSRLTESVEPSESPGPCQSADISQSISITEWVWKVLRVGTEWVRYAFVSQAKKFCPGTERLGQKSWDNVQVPSDVHRLRFPFLVIVIIII